MNLTNFLTLCHSEKGGSYRLTNGQPTPESGYMVSLKGYERQVDELTSTNLKNYILEHSQIIHEMDLFVGVWEYRGKWYLDLSQNIKDLHRALSVGKERNQISIYDCQNRREVYCD